MLTSTLGTVARLAKATGMPLDSVARSICGKARSPTSAIGGAVRLAPVAIFGAGFFASFAGGGLVAAPT